MTRHTQILALVLMTVLAVQGCASWSTPKTQADRTKALLTFGVTLDGAGNMFVAVGSSFNSALDSGMITPDVYKKWAAFATPFKPAYDKAVTAWGLARTANNLNSMEDIKTQIGPLLSELAVFGVTIFQVTTAK